MDTAAYWADVVDVPEKLSWPSDSDTPIPQAFVHDHLLESKLLSLKSSMMNPLIARFPSESLEVLSLTPESKSG
jgi:hypothetical protein